MTLIDRLTQYNAWRRGETDDLQPNSTQFGKDIDEAIARIAEPCPTCKQIAALVKREQSVRDQLVNTDGGHYHMSDHGKACDALWEALYRLADGHADVVPSVETKTEKIVKQTRKAVVKELKQELPGLIDQALEGLAVSAGVDLSEVHND